MPRNLLCLNYSQMPFMIKQPNVPIHAYSSKLLAYAIINIQKKLISIHEWLMLLCGLYIHACIRHDHINFNGLTIMKYGTVMSHILMIIKKHNKMQAIYCMKNVSMRCYLTCSFNISKTWMSIYEKFKDCLFILPF